MAGWIVCFCAVALLKINVHGSTVKATKYEPNWKSIDSRPLPSWYDDVKVGVFIVWGIYSVPSFGNEWFWQLWQKGEQKFVDFMKKNYRPGFTYPDFAAEFTAEMFNPDQWAEIIEASGAK